jgi:hypothetical protein
MEEQAMQRPVQSVWQQTLSTQSPLPHSVAESQGAPMGSLQSPPAHTPPPAQGDPSALGGLEHMPVPGSQVPASWQVSCGMQTTGVPAQTPAWQESACVHRFPSSHPAPFIFGGFEQTPLPGSQVPASWHWSCGGHTTGFAPVHVPAWHVSACVHALPSLQALPSGLDGLEQTPVAGLHVPASWHWS